MRFLPELLLLALAGTALPALPALADPCRFDDRAALLALPPQAFDRGPGPGWEAGLVQAGCTLEVAELFAAYRTQPKAAGNTALIWHEAQLRALGGQRDPASDLMRLTYKPAHADPDGWNLYLDATIAFLDDDLPALKQARARLAALPAPAPPAAQWPPRLEIVDALVRCMYQPYELAYHACPATQL